MNFGHLEVLHAKFHGRTISNLGDYVAQTDKQTNRQTNRQTDKQTDNAIYIVDYLYLNIKKIKNNTRTCKYVVVSEPEALELSPFGQMLF